LKVASKNLQASKSTKLKVVYTDALFYELYRKYTELCCRIAEYSTTSGINKL